MERGKHTVIWVNRLGQGHLKWRGWVTGEQSTGGLWEEGNWRKMYSP